MRTAPAGRSGPPVARGGRDGGGPATTLLASYILPTRASAPRSDLTPYLQALANHVEVLVVDGSSADVFAAHARMWVAPVRHLAVDPDCGGLNGKVNGVVTGLRHASHDHVVIADDDVRYDTSALARLVALLDEADVVVPQNYFDPLPWHARWDTARSLINRALAVDHPGTLGVRRRAVAPGYDGDVLFENLELIRTAVARGATVRAAPDLFVRRLPCSSAHFRSQRVRQAYDSLAQPARLLAELAILPLLVVVARRGPVLGPVAGAVGACTVAEVGRWRAHGRDVFPATASLFAPLWVLERGICSWLALANRWLRGGVPYAGNRFQRAATSARRLRDQSLAA